MALLILACGPKSPPPRAESTPSHPVGAPVAGDLHLAPPPPAATPAEAPQGVPARELAQRLRSADDAERRGQIVGELWEVGTPEAVEILRQHFFVERDVDVKADLVAGLVEQKAPETRELRFGILSAALAPTQPVEVRVAAIAMVTEFDDVRAAALLQPLLQDASEEVRDTAKEALAARQDADAR